MLDSTFLMLPQVATHELPPHTGRRLTLPVLARTSPISIWQNALSTLDGSPALIFANEQTPLSAFVAACRMFPAAIPLLRANQQWQHAVSGELMFANASPVSPNKVATSEPASAPTPTITVAEPLSSTSPPTEKAHHEAPPKQASRSGNSIKGPRRDFKEYAGLPVWEWRDSELERDAYIKSTWGKDPDNVEHIKLLLRVAESRSVATLQAVRKSIENGERFARMWSRIETAFKTDSEKACRDLERILSTDSRLTPFMKEGLRRKFNDHMAYHNRKRMQYFEKKQLERQQPEKAKTTLAPARFDDHHPNSLRHLLPGNSWKILIDETGTIFSQKAATLDDQSRSLGRFVAVAVPGNVPLENLPRGFHSTDMDSSEIDNALATLLRNHVGILGITVKDPMVGALQSWLMGIYSLIRLVLRQLPFDGPTTVSVLIENRSTHNSARDLSYLAEILKAELTELSPHYQDLTIDLRIVAKDDDPWLGYADAVAFTWASTQPESKQRLQHSRLEGHCLINPTHDVTDRLYEMLDNELPEPADWYRILAELADEPRSGLLATTMQRLGERIVSDTQAWSQYVRHVKQQLDTTGFSLVTIANALEWLDRYAPAESSLPISLQLEWRTAQLAVANHFGETETEIAKICQALGDRLIEEEPQRVCEIDLRNAVHATNNFNFAQASQALSRWANHDHGRQMVGRGRWAKVLSSLGQHAAFEGRLSDATVLFDQALAEFAQLSDPSVALRESHQTTIYRLTAQCDNRDCPDNAFHEALAAYLGSEANLLAIINGGNARRYDLHLLWRAIILRPEATQQWRTSALAQRAHWQNDEGHPWPLINAYRALALHQVGEIASAAACMQEAVAQALDDSAGPTLQWMGLVLDAVAGQYDLAPGTHPTLDRWEKLRETMPRAPHANLQQAITDGIGTGAQALAEFLGRTLPFNFH